MNSHNSFISFAEEHGFDLSQELVIDCFAGGGGASEGMEIAMREMRKAGLLPEDHRCAVDIAINHDPKAIAMHMANHPKTMHLTADIWTADPLTVTGGIAVGALWASPDCRGFSKAKGSAPVSKSVRSLAWVVAHWAEQVRPREIYMENVEEFQDWGDLDISSRPDKAVKGKEFKRWVRKFRRMGYTVEWRVLRANFYGAPTIRKRLYIMMRCDGDPIVWPEPTHADPRSEEVANGSKKPWPVAADILDFDRPCPSVLMTKEEAKDYTKATGIKIIRPLAEKSEERIAKGTKRYVIDKGEDAFIVLCNHGGRGFRGQGLDDGFATVTKARDAHGLVEPTLAPFVSHGQHGGASRSAEDPAHTITASKKDTDQVVSVFLTKHTTGGVGSGPGEPAPTVTANSFRKRPGGASPLAATAVYLAQHNGGPRGPIGRPADEPASTLTVEGSQQQVVSAFLARQFGASVGSDTGEPLGTITAGGGGKTQAVSAHMISMKGSDRRASDVDQPAPATTAQGQHTGVVMPFLHAYYGSEDTGFTIDNPARTATTKDRFGLDQVAAELPPLTEAQLDSARKVAAFLRKYDCWDEREFVTVGPWIVIDIGMRMLTPRELARAQGFRDGYILAAPYEGRKLTATDQRHKIGNSVCKDVAYSLFRQNYRPKPRMAIDDEQGWLLSSARAAA